jgi:glutamin-(asparagin-)ase
MVEPLRQVQAQGVTIVRSSRVPYGFVLQRRAARRQVRLGRGARHAPREGTHPDHAGPGQGANTKELQRMFWEY